MKQFCTRYQLVFDLALCSVCVASGRMVGEWRATFAIPGLVSVRPFPPASRWRTAPESRHPGRKALRHSGAGRPCFRNLHQGFCTLPTTSQCHVSITPSIILSTQSTPHLIQDCLIILHLKLYIHTLHGVKYVKYLNSQIINNSSFMIIKSSFVPHIK